VVVVVVDGVHLEQEVLHLHQHLALLLVQVTLETLDHFPHRVEITQTPTEAVAAVDKVLQSTIMVAPAVLVSPCFVGHLPIQKIRYSFLQIRDSLKFQMASQQSII
jgi:hypothetical protein